MKTVRFTNLVQKCGKPENHLILVKPQQDKALQRAMKETRVLTVYQPTVGMKAEHGEVGFAPGYSRQFFIFSKSLKSFQGKRVVGIKYDNLETNGEDEVLPKSGKPASNAVKSRGKKPSTKGAQVEELPKSKVVLFPKQKKEDVTSHDVQVTIESIEDFKSRVRRAMKALEQGKQVVAFNLLKSIVDE